MVCLADIAARLCGRDLSHTVKSPLVHSEPTMNFKPVWRRASRAKAALAANVLAIEEAVRVLEDLDIPYAQPLFGKLVVEPPPAVRAARPLCSGPRRSVSGLVDGDADPARRSRIRASTRGSGSSNLGLCVSTCKAVAITDIV